MTTSRNHQEAHGIGQAEEQLNQQADAAYTALGGNETDRDIVAAANRDAVTSLDKIIDTQG